MKDIVDSLPEFLRISDTSVDEAGVLILFRLSDGCVVF